MNESEYQVKRMLEDRGFRVLRNGWPDFLGIRENFCRHLDRKEHGPRGPIRYGVAGFEVKVGNDTCSPAQVEMHKVLGSVGIPVHIVGPKEEKNYALKTIHTIEEIQAIQHELQSIKEDAGDLVGRIAYGLESLKKRVDVMKVKVGDAQEMIKTLEDQIDRLVTESCKLYTGDME